MAITAWRAGSIALAGFALDSLIEIYASVVVIWQLTDRGKERERLALRLIGRCVLLLAFYLLVQSALAWVRRRATGAEELRGGFDVRELPAHRWRIAPASVWIPER